MTTCDLFKAGLGPQIDIAAPTVDVSSIANGAYLRGTVTLSGSASDDVGLASVNVIVTINSTQVASIAGTIASGAWQAALDTKALSGGVEVQADLDIRATDNSGKVSDKKIVVYFDNVVPAITGMSPSTANLASSDFALSEKTTITGSVKDGLGLAKTNLTVGDISLSDASHPASWSAVLDTSQFYDAGGNALHGATKLSSGLYQVGYSLISTDYAGNTSEPLTGLLYVNPDGSPVVNVSALTAGVNTSITYPRASSAVQPTTTLPGIATPGSTFKFRVTDLDGIDLSQLYVALALGSAESANPTAAPSALPVPATIYKVGDNSLKQAILDSASLSGGGTAPTRAEYSFTLPSAVGEYMLFIHAADYAANKVTGTSAERYLPSAPSGGSYAYTSLYVTNQTTSVTVDVPAEGTYYSALNASGEAASDDKLKDLSFTITDKATSTKLSEETVAVTGAPTAYSWTYSKAGLPDGHYSLAVQASSQAGVPSGTVTHNFFIDTSKPTATINPLTGSQSGTIGISGTSSDSGSGIAKVEYQLDSTSGAWTPAGGTASWSGSLNLSSETEGPHTLYARATDVAGNVTDSGSYASAGFDVDRNLPQATETFHTAVLIQSATAVSFAGKADDFALTAGREATSVELSYSKDGGAAAKITRTASGTASGFTWNSATGDWSWTLPAPSDHSGDGFYTITLTATDRAGKTASVTRTAQIDTTAPTLDVSTPASGMSTSSTTCLISGTSFDTGGAGFDGANDVQYNLNGTGWKPATLSGSYSVSETLSGTEGPQTLIVRSTDKLGNQSADITRSFFYDLAPPVMVESTVGGASNPATKSSSTRSSFYFSGTTFDSDALSGSGDLQVAIDYAAPVDVESLSSGAYTNSITAVDSKNKTWRLNVAVGSGGLADGVHNFVFTAKDIAGKTASVTRTVTVDTTGPVSVISSPTAGLGPGDSAYWLSGTTTSFAGSADDLGAGATGVASVYYTVVAKGAGMPAFSTSTWSSAGGNTSWNAIYPFGSAQGEFTLYVAAVDAVGNPETAPAPRNFGVDQAPPTASEAHAASFASKSLFTLSGLITDGNALASLSVTEKKGAAAAVTVGLSSPATVGGASQSWETISLPLGANATSMANHDNDGSYTYDIIVKDAAGKTTTLSRTVSIDTTSPVVTLTTPASAGLWVSGSAYTIGGEATDSAPGASGVASVQYRVKTGAAWSSWITATWSSTSGAANTSGNWSATITGLSEGSHDLEIEATDAAANATASPTTGSFGVDLSPPTLASDTPASPIIAAGAAAFTGFAGAIGDTNDMAAAHSFTVSYTKNGGTAVEADVPYTYTAHSTANAWSWTPFPAGINAASHAQDGIYVFTFTATDVAGKQTNVVRNLTIDTMAPQITMTAPTNPIAWYKDSPLKVTGVADDGAGSGVKNVYVRWDIAANGHSGDDLSASTSGWTKASNTVSWNADLTLSTEGALKLWIKAVDNYGNWTTPAEATAIAVDFGYDKTNPTFTSTDSTPSVTNSAFTLGGVLEDTGSGLKSLSITVNGVTSTGTSYSGGLWSYPVSALPVDGSYAYVFTATDNANNVSTITRTVYVDTAAPAVSFNNVDPSKSTAATAVTLVDASPKITGSIVDDTGVGTVTSTIRYSTDAGATWSVVEGPAALATSGANAKSRTFSKDLSAAPFLGDGLYQIVITAGDTLASPNSASTTAVWFRLDRNNPTLPALSSSASSANVNADFTLTSTASSPNLSSVQWKLDTGAFVDLVTGEESSGTSSYAINLAGAGASLAEGPHTITVQATSTGLRTTSQSYTFLVDRTAPTPTVSQPTAGAYLSGATAVVSGGATDSGGSPSGVKSVEYQLARGLSASSSGSTITAAGTHGLAAGDLVRFAAYPSHSLPAALDATATYYVRAGAGTATFEVSTTSGGSAVAVGSGSGFFVSKVGTWKSASFGGNAWSDLAVDTTGLSEGNYLLLVRATDNAGNVSAPLASRICVDQGVPSLAFTGMPASGVLSAAFTLSGTAIDPADSSLPGSANGVASVILSLDSGFAHSASVPQDLAAGTSWSFDFAVASSDFFYGLSPTSYAGVPEGAHTIYVRATDKAGRITELSYSFTKDSVKPAVAYSNLATNGSTVYQDSSSKIMGTFTDSSGVASMSARIEKYDYASLSWSTTGGMAWTDLGSTGNAKSISFELDLGSSGHNLADGRYRLSVIAADIAGDAANTLDTSASPIEFMVASADPGAAYTAPALGSFQKGTITVTGTASDPNAISSVLLKCSQSGTISFASGYTTATLSAASWSGGVASYTWSASVPVTGLSDGAATVYVQATAGSGRTKQLSRDFTLDTAAPAITISSPSSGSRSVGSLTIVGTTNDPGAAPSGVTGSIQYQLGITANLSNASSWTNANVTGGSYSWSIALGLMSGYANTTYATKCDTSGNSSSSGNLWRLPIYFQASDNAGNVQQLTSFWLILDPDGNIPVVTITQPSSSGQTYGGQQRITGTATQPIWIHDIEVAIDPSGGSSFPDAVSATISGSSITAAGHGLATGRSVFFSGTTLPQVSGSSVSTSLPYFVVSVSGDTIQVASTPGGAAISFSSAGTGVTIGVWGPATLLSTGNSVMWYYDINQGSYLPQGGASSQTVSVQARAWNSPASGGSVKGSLSGTLTSPLTMKFDSTFPKIQGLEVSPSSSYSDAGARSYYNQITVAGQVYVLGYVQSSKGITKIEKVETSNGSGSTSLYDTSGGSYGSTSAVTPPSAVSAASLPVGGSYQAIITSLGTTDWTAMGCSSPSVGTVFKPTSVGGGTGTAIPSDSAGTFSYYVAIPVDTASYYASSSGVYSFDIRATDMTTPSQVSSQSIALNADNFYPTTSLVNPGVVAAGNFVAGQRYMIVSAGTTDFTAVGALASAAGQTFVATGLGSGSGTAIPVLVGTTQKLQGSATDTGTGSGTIGGLAKVVVYLTNTAGTQVIDLKNGAGAYQAPTTLQAKDMANGGVVGSVKYPVTTAYSNYFASIDSISEIGATDSNGDGFLESFLTNGNARDWWAQIDTTVQNDGPVTMHAVIWDNAGNATHYAQTAFISNHAPALASVYLGTDVNGDGTVAAGEMNESISVASLGASNFTVRNSRLKFQINLSSSPAAGNGPAYYSVKYNGTEYNGTLTSNTITISNFGSIPDSGIGSTNDRAFSIFVYDSAPGTTPGVDSQFFKQVVRLTINNADHVAPTIDLAPFGRRWSAPTDSANGGVNTDAGKALGPVAAYTDNVAGSIGSLLGHVEYATDSNYNPLSITLATPGTGSFTNSGANGLAVNSIVYFAWTTAPSSTPNGTGPYYVIGTPTATSFQVSTTRGGGAAAFGSAGTGITLATPDLSGRVIFRGKFADDQRIASLSATIPGYNGGSAVTLATWSASANSGAGGLVANTSGDWSFSADSGTESVSMSDGHVANWAFAFDTSKIATVAAANVSVTFTVADGGSNASSSSIDVDVVPYITDFSRSAPFASRLAANTMNPGAGGYYPVYQGAAGHAITGFNLYYSAASATIGSTSLTVSSPSTTSLTVEIPTALTTTVGDSNASLKVTVNGIDSINNGTKYTSSSATNANGVLFSSYLTEEGSYTNARKIYVDDQSPTVNIAPFGQKYPAQPTDDATNGPKNLTSVSDYTDNVPYSGTDATKKANWLGHVEYSDDNVVTSSRAAISGQVTVRGKAFDNERINQITVAIPGFNGGSGLGAAFPIYTLANGCQYYTGSAYASTGSSYAASGSAYTIPGAGNWVAWADGTDYKLSDSTRVERGHVLNWNFTFDSSKLSSVAAAGVGITVTVYDANNTPHTASDAIIVDVAPYVSKVTTSLSSAFSSSPSVMSRSALGYYPVREGETVTVTGFNLNGASTGVSMNGYSTITPSGSTSSITFTVPTVAATTLTGPLVLTVNSVASVNNSNLNTRSWNQNANGINNDLLTDNTYLYIWRFTNIVSNSTIRYPSFRVGADANQTIGFVYDSGAQYVRMNSGATLGSTSDFQVDQSYTQWYDTSAAVDPSGNMFGSSMNGDSGGGGGDQRYSGNYANYNFFALNTATNPGTNSATNYGAYSSGSHKVALESSYNGTTFDSNRIQNPKTFVGSGGNIYHAYYDKDDSQLKFRWGLVTTSWTISNITVANPGVFTTSAAHGLTAGDSVTISSTGTYPTLNAILMTSGTTYYVATVPSSTTFTLTTTSGSTTGMRVQGAGTGTRVITVLDASSATLGGTNGAISNHGTSLGSATNFQVVAGTGATGTSTSLGSTNVGNIGSYIALGATSTGTAVVAWYDSSNQRLLFSYNPAPTDPANAANWGVNTIAIDSDFAGWFVDLVVDSADHVHIAYYNSSNGDLRYAYISSPGAAPHACTVDSFLSVGTNISITVDNSVATPVPYISYYMGAYTQTKNSLRVAWPIAFAGSPSNGVSDDAFTGSWEVMSVPTSKVPLDYRVGIGIKKNGASVNVPLLGYGTTTCLETAQLK